MGTWKPFVMGIAGVLVGVILLVGVGYAANIFTVDRDGTVRLVVADNGRVGIGIDAPASPLHVQTSGTVANITARRGDGKFTSLAAGTLGSNICFDDSGYFVVGKQPVADMGSGGGITNLMRVTSTGMVGIGSDDPKTKLHVTGLPEYANNAAALAAGLTAGAFYRTGEFLKVAY